MLSTTDILSTSRNLWILSSNKHICKTFCKGHWTVTLPPKKPRCVFCLFVLHKPKGNGKSNFGSDLISIIQVFLRFLLNTFFHCFPHSMCHVTRDQHSEESLILVLHAKITDTNEMKNPWRGYKTLFDTKQGKNRLSSITTREYLQKMEWRVCGLWWRESVKCLLVWD